MYGQLYSIRKGIDTERSWSHTGWTYNFDHKTTWILRLCSLFLQPKPLQLSFISYLLCAFVEICLSCSVVLYVTFHVYTCVCTCTLGLQTCSATVPHVTRPPVLGGLLTVN